MKQLLIADNNSKVIFLDDDISYEFSFKLGDKLPVELPLADIVRNVLENPELMPISEYIENIGQIIAVPIVYNNSGKAVVIYLSSEIAYKKLVEEEQQRKKAIFNLLISWRKIIMADDLKEKLDFAVRTAKTSGWKKITFCYKWKQKVYYTFCGYSEDEEKDIVTNVSENLPEKLESISNEMMNSKGIYYIVPGFKRTDSILGKDKSKYWKPEYLIVAPLMRRKTIYGGWLILDDPLVEEDPAREELMTLIGFFQMVISELDIFQTNNELINVQKEKDNLLCGIAHDIKNPLAVISGYANILLDINISNEKRDSFLNIILSKSKQISLMIEDLLELSHLQDLEKLVNPQKNNLKEVVKSAYLAQFDFADQRGVKLVISLPESEVYLLVDKSYIKRAISNLLNNAVKFSNKGGEVKLSLYLHDNRWNVKVQDQGIGINDSEMEKIFKEFYRSDRAASFPGTGLGLSLVKRILQLHNAQIFVESSPDKGSSFIIRFQERELEDED